MSMDTALKSAPRLSINPLGTFQSTEAIKSIAHLVESIQDNDRYSEQNFGRYEVYNPNFRCTSSSSATTNYWFGLRV